MSLSKIFSELENDPLDPMLLADYTRKCISEFSQKRFQTSNTLYHLGIITAYENYFGDPKNVKKPAYKHASQNAQQAFLTDVLNLSEIFFINKVQEQQALKDANKLLGFLKHHRPNYKDEINDAIDTINYTINLNEELLENVFFDNDAFYKNLNRRSKLIRPMHEYRKYTPKTTYVSPIDLHEIIPILQKRCINIATTTQASCDTQFSLILKQVGILRAFAKHGKYSDLRHINGLDDVPENMQHQAVSQVAYDSYEKISSRLGNSNEINSMITGLVYEIFPKHGHLIGIKNPNAPQPQQNFK